MSDASLEEWIASQGGKVTLVLTDVVRSTLLLYGTGTISYMRVIEAHRSRATGLIESLGGRVIDLSGDATFAGFARTADAFAYATSILTDTGDPGLRVRVGVHHGRVHAQGPSLFGRSVHFVTRLAERGGHESELRASEDARAALEAEAGEGLGSEWVREEGCELPGVPGKHTLWQLTRSAALEPPGD
jgi:class 3 adenylate cyclase